MVDKYAQLPLCSWVIKRGVFVHFSFSMEDLGEEKWRHSWRIRCTVPLEAGEKPGFGTQRLAFWGFWLWSTERQGLRADELGNVCHEPWQPIWWTQEGKGSISEGTVLRRDWPWLVENSPWNYPSWANKKYTVRGKVWPLERGSVMHMTLGKFFHLSDP